MAPVGGMSLAESFVRLTAEQSFFVPLYKMVVAARFRLGHIFNKEFERIMPIERFFLGGANSVRGYDTDFVPPLGRYCDGKSKPQVVPQGGRSMVNANIELRFPLVGSLGGVVFQDSGALHDSSLASIRAPHCVAASGFGLRYQTPVGPLRFDVGRRWGRRSEDLRRIVWFLGFGSAF
jgi:outer membrane translocation and assembly module TamA